VVEPRVAGTPFNGAALAPAAIARCATLRAAGLVAGDTPAAQAASAYDALRASGWSEAALAEAALNAAFDLWRAIAAGYASAYARAPWDAMPCGYGYAVVAPDGTPMPAPPLGLALWWAMGSGIPPMLGMGLLDGMAAQSPHDPAFAGLACLRGLAAGADATARALQQGIAGVRASGMPQVPTIVLHGAGDGLIPPAFSSRPYVAAAQATGANLRYWEVDNAQHFDAFLAVPAMGARYVPLLPYVWQALDQTVAALEGGPAPAPSQRVRTTPRMPGQPLGAAQLKGLRADPGPDAWP
jgi:hydroxybutyrate-dimer hydrolase